MNHIFTTRMKKLVDVYDTTSGVTCNKMRVRANGENKMIQGKVSDLQ